MAKYKLGAGVEIDTLTQHELREHLDRTAADIFREQARGFTTSRFDATDTVSAGALSLPAAGHATLGPSAGFAWRIQRIAVSGLLSGDTLSIWRGDTNANHFIDTVSAAKPAIYPNKGLILRGDERLLFTGSSLNATGAVSVNGEATEVSELDLYKVL
jgi:hypothetical protein